MLFYRDDTGARCKHSTNSHVFLSLAVKSRRAFRETGLALSQRCSPLFSELLVVLEEIATFATFFIFTNYFATFRNREQRSALEETIEVSVMLLFNKKR